MEKHIVKILAVDYLTHNVRRFVVEKPVGYFFTPGQATEVAINRSGLEEERRPFTFTSLPNAPCLEFIIKIYKGHDGITEKLAMLEPGDELIIHDVWGAINYRGPGIFIAGGAGITPFIAILRSLRKSSDLPLCTLLFANHTETDIILKDELHSMLPSQYIDVLRMPLPGVQKRFIDEELISACSGAPGLFYYICGPDQFTTDMVDILNKIGINETQIIVEQ